MNWFDYFYTEQHKKHKIYFLSNADELKAIGIMPSNKEIQFWEKEVGRDFPQYDLYSPSYYLLFWVPSTEKFLYIDGGNCKAYLQGRDSLDLDYDDFGIISGTKWVDDLRTDFIIHGNTSIRRVIKEFDIDESLFKG
jgi:hypothetical protein